MLIILEGVDCSGKSTLAQKIMTRLSLQPNTTVELLHRGPPKSHPVQEYMIPLSEYKPNTSHHIICDRWHWGEAVYPEILDRKSEMTSDLFRTIEQFLAERGAIVILLDPPQADLTARMNTRGDELINVQHMIGIRQRYQKIYARTIMDATRFNDVPSADQVIELAMRAEAELKGMELS